MVRELHHLKVNGQYYFPTLYVIPIIFYETDAKVEIFDRLFVWFFLDDADHVKYNFTKIALPSMIFFKNATVIF